MLTPAKIKNHHFDAVGRNAYKADSVDSFFEEVAESYEQMFRENGEMYKKINLLAERLEEYRNDEDNIRNALLTAQRMAEKITREANEAADAALNEAKARAVAENERTDAYVTDVMGKANYQAQAVIDDANKQAQKIIYDATHESKEAAISARDIMIKEEASLEMMKIEVTKFKNQILDAYKAQLELIEKLPEVVYAQFEQPEDEAVEIEDIPNVEEHEVKTEELDVAKLQQMIDETEDTDAEDDPYVEELDVEEVEIAEAVKIEEADDAEDAEFVLPELEDDTSDEELDKMVDSFTADSSPADISFKKPAEQKDGFKVNFSNIGSFDSDDVDDEDELDDLDDDDDDGFSAKLKGFFKK